MLGVLAIRVCEGTSHDAADTLVYGGAARGDHLSCAASTATRIARARAVSIKATVGFSAGTRASSCGTK
jgi:hypothetical protein